MRITYFSHKYIIYINDEVTHLDNSFDIIIQYMTQTIIYHYQALPLYLTELRLTVPSALPS